MLYVCGEGLFQHSKSEDSLVGVFKLNQKQVKLNQER